MSNEGCPIHNVEFKVIEAGISRKTGRPYNSFVVCPVEGCKERPHGGHVFERNPVTGVALGGTSSDISARLDGIEQKLDRVIKGLAMVLSHVSSEVVDPSEVPDSVGNSNA